MTPTDPHYLYAADRLERLRAEAATARLAEIAPLRTRVAQLLHRLANRLDAAPPGRAVPGRG
jgi:hypothetical protein